METQLPPVYGNVNNLKNCLINLGSDWAGPKYPVNHKARQKIQLQSYDRNSPRMVELCKFQTKKPLPRVNFKFKLC